MKLLTLIRHAKSSWKEPGTSDFDRPLNARGKRDAPEMGQRLAERGAVPERILSSSAKRARRTARAIAGELGIDPAEVELTEDLYLASPEQILEALYALDPALGHVALVAHNPGVTELLNALAGSRIANVPTCGVARLRLDSDRWTELRLGAAELIEFDTPKQKPRTDAPD